LKGWRERRSITTGDLLLLTGMSCHFRICRRGKKCWNYADLKEVREFGPALKCSWNKTVFVTESRAKEIKGEGVGENNQAQTRQLNEWQSAPKRMQRQI
jgi:hypothetical protein